MNEYFYRFYGYNVKTNFEIPFFAYENRPLDIIDVTIIAKHGNDAEKEMFISNNDSCCTVVSPYASYEINIAIIAYLSWPLAVFTLAITPISVYTSRFFARKVKLIYKTISDRNGLLSSWIFEIIKGIQDIKLLSAAKGVLLDFLGKSIQIIRLQIKANKIEVLSERVNSGISLIWQLVLYIVLAYFIVNGNLTLGGFTACVSYFGKCISSFNALNNHITGISRNMVSCYCHGYFIDCFYVNINTLKDYNIVIEFINSKGEGTYS